MAQIPLNFAAFYQCAIEGHTSLFKYDAVSILLLGIPKAQQDPAEGISGAEVTNYTSGKKRIKDTIMTKLLEIKTEDAEGRIQKLGIQDIGMVAYSLKNLIAKADLGPDASLNFSEAYRNGFLAFIAEVFLAAIRYPPKNVRTLTQEEKKVIAACWDDLDTQEWEPLPSVSSSKAELTIAPPPSQTDTISRKMTQEEIEMLLDGLSKNEQNEERSPANDFDLPNVLHIASLRRSGASETINIVLSAGITALSDFFDDRISVGFPHFDFCEDQRYLNRLLFGNCERVTVLHRFFSEKVSSFGAISGFIAIALNRKIFSDLWEQSVKDLTLHFSSAQERSEFKRSISGELGSIFTGISITSLADFVSETFIYETADLRSLESLFLQRSPVFVGSLHFHSFVYKVESEGYLLLDWQSAQMIMDKLEQSVGSE